VLEDSLASATGVSANLGDLQTTLLQHAEQCPRHDVGRIRQTGVIVTSEVQIGRAGTTTVDKDALARYMTVPMPD